MKDVKEFGLTSSQKELFEKLLLVDIMSPILNILVVRNKGNEDRNVLRSHTGSPNFTHRNVVLLHCERSKY